MRIVLKKRLEALKLFLRFKREPVKTGFTTPIKTGFKHFTLVSEFSSRE